MSLVFQITQLQFPAHLRKNLPRMYLLILFQGFFQGFLLGPFFAKRKLSFRVLVNLSGGGGSEVAAPQKYSWDSGYYVKWKERVLVIAHDYHYDA